MTALVDAVRGEIEASLRFAAMSRDAERKPGLSMSALGVCTSRAVRTIRGETPSGYSDPWNSLRGTYLHAGIQQDRAAYGTPASQEQTVSFDFDGLIVEGHLDESLQIDGQLVVVDYKTRDLDECRRAAKHGPDRDSAMATTGYALAVGADAAILVYVPVKGSFADWTYVPLDLDYWKSEALVWLRDVRTFDGPTEQAPRDKPPTWCKAACPFFDECRGGHDFSVYEEITDPTFRQAVQLAYEAQQDGREKDRKQHMSLLKDVEGRVDDLLLTWVPMKATPNRRAHMRPSLRRIKTKGVAA